MHILRADTCQLGASKFARIRSEILAATKMAAHVEREVQAWPAEGAIERLERLDRLDRQDRRDREEARERQEAARSAAVAAAALHAQGAPDRMVAAGAALLKELVGMGQGHLVDGWQPGEDEEDKRRLFLQLQHLLGGVFKSRFQPALSAFSPVERQAMIVSYISLGRF